MSTFFIGVPTEVHIPGLMQADQRSLNPAIPLMSIGVIQHQIRLRLQFSQHATSLMGMRIAVGGLTTLCDAVIFVQWQVITKKGPAHQIDRDIAAEYLSLANAGNSVWYSWEHANAISTKGKDWLVLVYYGEGRRYYRMPGFPGNTYPAPNRSTTPIYRYGGTISDQEVPKAAGLSHKGSSISGSVPYRLEIDISARKALDVSDLKTSASICTDEEMRTVFHAVRENSCIAVPSQKARSFNNGFLSSIVEKEVLDAGIIDVYDTTMNKLKQRNERMLSMSAGKMRTFLPFYLMLIPGAIYFILFKYAPLWGILISFKNYKPIYTFATSEWVGLKYYIQFFNRADFLRLLRNTCVIGLNNILIYFPMPVILALMIHGLGNNRFTKSVQAIVYIPHFISWVVVVTLTNSIFGDLDIINSVMRSLGMKSQGFLYSESWFRPLILMQTIWKECGWGTIIFTAALTAVNADLYEAARMDGAGTPRAAVARHPSSHQEHDYRHVYFACRSIPGHWLRTDLSYGQQHESQHW